ncbi:MAG: DUF1611 domain-containing protein [Actinomycetota bacterium]|nr:DUF1611 domain-containing protein [Actinomycetota bacterium]
MSDRSWIVLTDGYTTSRNAKTAHGVLRYARDRVVAVLDRENAGRTMSEVMPSLSSAAPIVADLDEAREMGGTSLLLGVATPGGWIPEHWRPWVLAAVDAGLEVANGLHRFLADDPELVERAAASGARLWDVRRPPDDLPLFSGKSLDVPQKTVLTVGSDCAVGKMTVSLELAAAAEADGIAAEFIATGQTGIMIAGKGIAVDRVISDFLSGAAETLVCEGDPEADVLMVEGQGGLWHPAYAGVTLGLLHGSAPHALVLCHQAGRAAIEEPPYTPLPPLGEMCRAYEEAASTVREARVVGVAVNCRGLSDEDAATAIAAVEDELGLPAADVFRGGGPKLWEAVRAEVGV